MAKPVNKTLVGLFVVGAIVLAVVAIAIFGSGKFLETRPKFVMFFSGSVHGLAVGSAVEFRGVKIGEVSGISAQFDPKTLSVVIPVYVEIEPETLSLSAEMKKIMGTRKYPYIKAMVAKGLKAQMRMKSLLTGQLYIAVDFYPDKPIRLAGLEKKYPEIPTIPSAGDVVMATLEKLPVSEIADRLASVTKGIEKIVNSPEIASSIENLNLSLQQINGLVRGVEVQIEPMASSFIDTSDAARSAFVQAEKTLALKEGEPGKIAEQTRQTLERANIVLEEMKSTLASYGKIADNNANIGYDLGKSLQEIEGAARSIRSLADYLERHPEALVKGKKASQGE